MEYSENDLLQLSGISHFCFCRRRWALINIEQQWHENVLTLEGQDMHSRVDDPFFLEKRKDVVISRSVPVVSYRLGLTGICDVVEFVLSEQGSILSGRQGRYLPRIVEYKHGEKDPRQSNELQLCAQAMCLEEMLSVKIESGFLFYGKIRRRSEVFFTDELRDTVQKYSEEMHAYFKRGYTPKVKPTKACRSCSLVDICLPGLGKKALAASKYIRTEIDSE